MGLTDSHWRALWADDGQLCKKGTPLPGVGLQIAGSERLGMTVDDCERRQHRFLVWGLQIVTGERTGLTMASCTRRELRHLVWGFKVATRERWGSRWTVVQEENSVDWYVAHRSVLASIWS